ncbi:MAG TPA: HAMP domain-containing sensor histidine kinase [Verrucomicrobiae bacterium]|jgi:signal transduction histidine kinase
MTATENRAWLKPESNPADSTPADVERRILILAPTGNDARLTAEFLASARLSPQICRDAPALCAEINRGCGAVVLAEETLGDSSIQQLVFLLGGQPSWSDLPILLITSGGEASQVQLRRLGIFGQGGNVILLERPFRPGTLISTIEVALRARQRQYEARDFVEELKRAHHEAKTANQAKDAFLAALSHELRTPLNPALLIASEFAVDRELPEPVRRNFETIRKNIELEARLIDDLLDLTRVTSGKMILRRERVDIHEILTDALNIVRPDSEEKDIQLDLELNATRSDVNGDAVRLQQVFWNILKNAVKFTPRSGTVVVKSSIINDDRSLSIQVTDTGIGMTADESARVFHPFAQGDHAGGKGTHRFGGLGLGLAISKNLVQLHSGTIVAESAGRNQGATFTVELPLAGN